jgi:hypothetical protein
LLAGSPRKGKERSSSVKTRLFLSLHERFYDAPRGGQMSSSSLYQIYVRNSAILFLFGLRFSQKEERRITTFLSFLSFFFFPSDLCLCDSTDAAAALIDYPMVIIIIIMAIRYIKAKQSS